MTEWQQQIFQEVKLGRGGEKGQAAGGEGGLSGDFFFFLIGRTLVFSHQKVLSALLT